LDAVHRALRVVRVIGVQVSVLARTLRDTADRIPAIYERQAPMPRAAEMLASTAGAVDAFSDALLDDPDDESTGSFAAARAEITRARSQIADIREDLKDLIDANLSRGVYLATLVVETERILDELEAAMSRRDTVAGADITTPAAQGGYPDTQPATRPATEEDEDGRRG
jgi:hypothetical protein